MGLFDLPSPVLGWADALLRGFLPAWLVLVGWGLVAGWVTMAFFRRISNQQRIAEIKREVKTNQKQMADFDGEMSELLPLAGKTLGLAFRQFGLALGPALVASLPAIFILVFLSNHYGRLIPEPGTAVMIESEPASAALAWQPASEPLEPGQWAVSWPAAGQSVAASVAGEPVLTLPLDRPAPLLHQRQWWNILIANPAGYLPDGVPVEVIHLDLPRTEVLGIGPAWMRGWMFTFFMAFMVFSVALKFMLRIE